METVVTFFKTYFDWLYIPEITIIDIIEIIIIAFVIYHVINWFKTTRALTLLKGIAVLLVFMGIAALFKFNTILWIFKNTISVGIIAVIIIFQPEFRRALEQLGRRDLVTSLFGMDDQKEKRDKLSDKSVSELAKAVFEMAKNKTGALIVIEKNVALGEYERTGISIDSVISSQLLINIFEHNTPLHDGAIIVRNNRIVSATCYLPLTDSLEVNKELGTRHRAGIGISEVSDSLTIIVSEETGNVSVAVGGNLKRNLDSDGLKKELLYIQNKSVEKNRFKRWKGRIGHEGKTAK